MMALSRIERTLTSHYARSTNAAFMGGSDILLIYATNLQLSIKWASLELLSSYYTLRSVWTLRVIL